MNTYNNFSTILVVDGVRSTHNVGSFFRTAECFGIRHVYLCGITPVPIDRFGRRRPDIAKVALGGEVSVPWTHVDDTVNLLMLLKGDGYHICALEQSSSSVPLSSFHGGGKPICLVVGAEVAGVSAPVLSTCDTILEIPQFGTKESLNVSVACGIALYLLCVHTR